jgi:hypothetical protein
MSFRILRSGETARRVSDVAVESPLQGSGLAPEKEAEGPPLGRVTLWSSRGDLPVNSAYGEAHHVQKSTHVALRRALGPGGL